MDSITRQNCKVLLAAFIEENDLSAREIAKAISCSEETISRILTGETLPTDKMLMEVGILIEIGLERYSNLSKSERKEILETIGTVGAGAIGFQHRRIRQRDAAAQRVPRHAVPRRSSAAAADQNRSVPLPGGPNRSDAGGLPRDEKR